MLLLLSPDSSKNSLALDVITHLLAKCCWLNLHIVPPHGDVFEIRDADGYGARWSIDGSKVSIVPSDLLRPFCFVFLLIKFLKYFNYFFNF